MFDTLLSNTAARFGIPADKAKQLLGLLIALIFNEKRGGVAGFIDLFRSRGLSGLVDSWIGDGPNQPIDAAQLEHALGAGDLDTLASQAGMERGVAASALAAMLPDAFNTLTEDGRIPVGIPDRIRGFMDGLGDFFRNLGVGALGLGAAAVGGVAHAAGRAGDAIGDAAENTVDAVGDAGRAAARTVDRAADRVGDVARDAGNGIGKWLPWLLLIGLGIAALFWFKGCSKHEATPAPAPVTTEAAAPAAASANSTFNFENVDGTKVNVSGSVPSDAEKTRLWDALKATFGDGNVNGDITVDAKAAPAGWLDKLVGLLPDLKAKGVKFGLDGDKLNIDTSGMSDEERFALSDKLRRAFSGYEITGLWDKAMAAFAGLKAGFSGDDLVKALDLSNVYFDTAKATITRDSLETLTKAAEYIKQVPAGTRIEVSGHTDSDGDDAANMTLSQQRADAVVAKLQELGVPAGILTAKGYGETKPVGDNATAEGKALNRRIDYAISK